MPLFQLMLAIAAFLSCHGFIATENPSDNDAFVEEIDEYINRKLANTAVFEYPEYYNVVNRLQELEGLYPDLVEVWSAQEKYNIDTPGDCCRDSECSGRQKKQCEQWFIKIANKTLSHEEVESNHSTRSEFVPFNEFSKKETPHVFFSGNLHGDEWVGPVTLVHMIEIILDGASHGSPNYNPYFNRLVNSRVLVFLPISNPWGYIRRQRVENGIDPNRDYPYHKPADKCMETTVSRAINEVFREHLFQTVITFHGGMQSLTYAWGGPNHPYNETKRTDFSPDHTGQDQLAGVMSRFAGKFKKFPDYVYGTHSDVVYHVDGGMEDWSYGGSWEEDVMTQCNPMKKLYKDYPPEKTKYNAYVLRAATFLVETSDNKIPPTADLGNSTKLEDMFSVGNANDGHVARNIRLSLCSQTLPNLMWL